MRMMMRARLHDDRGATIVIVGLMLVAILGMVALVTDIGGLVTMKRRVVTASDSAALAAAQSFARSQGGLCGSAGGNATALAAADSFAQDNISSATSVAFTPNCPDKSVEVQYKAPVHFFFAQVLGQGSGDEVPATSTARWGPVGRAKPAPIMVFESQLADCHIPDDVTQLPRECTLDYPTSSGSRGLTPPFLAALDLSQWNNADAGACHVDANELRGEIDAGGWHDYLDLNQPGSPTPDCADNGVEDSVMADLEGKTLTFPVVSQTLISDGGGSGGVVMNVIGFITLTVPLDGWDSGLKKLKTVWTGPSSQPGVPVIGGQDFGDRAVRLVANAGASS